MPAGHAEPEAIVTQTAASRWTAAAKRAEEQGEDSALAQRRVAHLSPPSRLSLALLVSAARTCACAPVHASPTNAVLVEQSVNFNPLVAARALLLQQVLCIWFVCGVFVIQMFVG